MKMSLSGADRPIYPEKKFNPTHPSSPPSQLPTSTNTTTPPVTPPMKPFSKTFDKALRPLLTKSPVLASRVTPEQSSASVHLKTHEDEYLDHFPSKGVMPVSPTRRISLDEQSGVGKLSPPGFTLKQEDGKELLMGGVGGVIDEREEDEVYLGEDVEKLNASRSMESFDEPPNKNKMVNSSTIDAPQVPQDPNP